jgi:hypothetical protein
VLLGYSPLHNVYKCLHVPSNWLYISRDVIFDETVFPFSNSPSSESPTQWHLVGEGVWPEQLRAIVNSGHGQLHRFAAIFGRGTISAGEPEQGKKNRPRERVRGGLTSPILEFLPAVMANTDGKICRPSSDSGGGKEGRRKRGAGL